MRGDRSVPRGEAGRVALRVRQLLADDDGYDDDPVDGDEGYGDGSYGDGSYGDGSYSDGSYGGGSYDDGAPSRWERLRARVPVRIDPGRRAAWGVGAAVLLAAIVTGLWLMSSRPTPVPVAARVPQVPGAVVSGTAQRRTTGAVPVPAGGSPAAAASPSSAGVVVVDVAGKVRRPGLYRLPSGSRIDDAVTAAGGPKPGVDLSSLNLAAPLADGQQILVGAPAGAQGPVGGGAPTASAAGSGGAGGSAAGPVDLNTATLEQLDGLPGIGPALAQRILDWRTQHGRFGTVDQLNDVSGIGDVKFAELKSLVSV